MTLNLNTEIATRSPEEVFAFPHAKRGTLFYGALHTALIRARGGLKMLDCERGDALEILPDAIWAVEGCIDQAIGLLEHATPLANENEYPPAATREDQKNRAVAWVFGMDRLSTCEKLLLILLATSVDRYDEVWLAVAEITEITGMDRKTVIASMHGLESAGCIKDTKRRAGMTKAIRVMRVLYPWRQE